MDMLQEYQYRVEHQHNDGSWSGLDEERAHEHDSASHDPERDWSIRTFRCVSCGEVMRLLSRTSPPAPDAE
jgi:hypothetical protein